MPKYNWTCHVCEKANQPDGKFCSECGFPAVSTGTQIERARYRAAGLSHPSRRYWVLPLEFEIPTFDVPADCTARARLEQFHEQLSEMHRHEDTLFNSRLQGFLVATSLLAAAFSQFREPAYVRDSIFIAFVGVSLSVTLGIVLWRTSVAIQWYIATLCKIEASVWLNNQRPYETRRLLRKSQDRIPLTTILAIYVPSVVALFWVMMGFLASCRA